MMRGMVIDMNDEQLDTLAQLRAFLDGTTAVDFAVGYSHIPQRFATLVNAFCCDYLNPYVNFHRPCLFAETITDDKGLSRKRYPYKLMMTPYEKFRSLHLAEQFLKSGVTFQQLDAQACAMSDNEASQRLNDARAILFKTIFNRSKSAA